ncbi:helix-turn-helix domain-containing protein [Pseudonocardia sp. HH130630-07]|uniref:helix-turn-helix domain-containing protein n=1 Tax=Pseudonocardia sp. HH130630-07 TaxID=1690815 RepID=UPI000814EDFF|nr:helix-turn-helix transcriptional regulator [Pseudonocardia sp. HH130630-07]ANY09280.1 transcriptional regulator [Pseudonocardia sp. HH130630-07]
MAEPTPGALSPLAAHRLAAGFTQEGLAERLGVDRGTVGRWERGAQAPQPWQRPALATTLRVSLAELDDLVNPVLPSPAPPAMPPGTAARVRRSRQQWLDVRNALGVRGRELTELAAWLYPESRRAPGGHVLAGPGWLLDRPVPLDSVRLSWSGGQRPFRLPGSVEHVLPLTDRGEPYAGYSRAVRDLVRPRLLENRLSYRLLDVRTGDGLELEFGTTTFFEAFDLKQALAHEFKAAWLASDRSVPTWDALPLRTAVRDPFDPSRLLMSPGISTLTVRRDRTGDRHRFVLHERDGGKVADGGGLCHVMPAGEFQPSSVDPADVRDDFSLWRTIMREFSEEFLGNPEHDGAASRRIDYAHDEPFRSFEQARAAGGLRLWHYGLVLEPLELGAIQMTVAVVDDVFDRLFADLVATNDEGQVVGRDGRTDMPFTAEAVDRLDPRLSASALTLLRLAWRDREYLLHPTHGA